jgi:hypothetical protein
MFFFFSNRLGCLGSLLISIAITAALLFMFGLLQIAGGSRSAVTSIRASRTSMAAMSSPERSTSAAPRFSFTRSRRRVPKIGTMLGPLARSQASATCAVVAPLAAASNSTASTTAWLASIASGVKRGELRVH